MKMIYVFVLNHWNVQQQMDQKINFNKVHSLLFKKFLKFIFILKIFQGKYEILLLENIERHEFITPQINGSPNSTCLTFYYYLTKRVFFY